ncbi:hypothetical protein N657DRAFT_642083 [Parathielavia appendiculata]|uniref:Secreted protein n=1 Tax=Parathielavia appendiculata TaxID=2587402 RepID=A0AAN6U8M1_9PEZI|nr:hypothetical protein N657DRAFT_642083 [Parathielavia appendiculata]
MKLKHYLTFLHCLYIVLVHASCILAKFAGCSYIKFAHSILQTAEEEVSPEFGPVYDINALTFLHLTRRAHA